MHVETLGEQVGRRLVIDFADQRQQLAGGTGGRFLGGHQMADHVGCLGHAFHFLDRGELDEFLVSAGRREAEGANAFGDLVERIPLLGVLAHEHGVQAIELRAGDVPVEVVRQYVSARYVRMDMAKMEGKYSVI